MFCIFIDQLREVVSLSSIVMMALLMSCYFVLNFVANGADDVNNRAVELTR